MIPGKLCDFWRITYFLINYVFFDKLRDFDKLCDFDKLRDFDKLHDFFLIP